MPKPSPDQLELPFEETTPKSTVNDMLRFKPHQKHLDYFMSTDKRVDHELPGPFGAARVDVQGHPTIAHVEARDLYEIDVTTFQEAAEGKRTVIVTTGPQLRETVADLPEAHDGAAIEYKVSVKLNDMQMRKLDELATYHHLDKEKALIKILDDYTISAPMPKSQDCRTVKREAGRTREKPEEWKIKEVMRRRTTCRQESDRTYVGNKSVKIFPGKDGRKKARRWLAEKIVIEEGL